MKFFVASKKKISQCLSAKAKQPLCQAKTQRNLLKHLLLTFIILFSSTNLFANTFKAVDLEKICNSSSESDHSACLLIFTAYMDGFIEGVSKGAIDTYKYDQEVLTLVKDVKMKDMAPRLKKVTDRSTCIQKVTNTKMVAAYLEYVQKNPAIRHKHYREAITRTIVSTYCKT